MPAGPRFATPEAARRAVTDRLKAHATHGPWMLADLQRQYAYDQLIERLYRIDDQWVIKGATALLAGGSRSGTPLTSTSTGPARSGTWSDCSAMLSP
jgi:hypothetical protein